MGRFYDCEDQEVVLPPERTRRPTALTSSKAATPEHSVSDPKLASFPLPSKNRQKDGKPPKRKQQDDDKEATGTPPPTKRKKPLTKSPKRTGESDVINERLAKMEEMQQSGNFPWLPPTRLRAKAWADEAKAEKEKLETWRKAKTTRERKDAKMVQQYKKEEKKLARAFHAWR
jgi:hypothetical protein